MLQTAFALAFEQSVVQQVVGHAVEQRRRQQRIGVEIDRGESHRRVA
jgi:hypothetical protein